MGKLLAGKKIVVGVSGSIAAFKVAGWVSTLAQEEAQVKVILTEAASKFVTPLTFSALSGEKVHTDMFTEDAEYSMAHIQLGQEADIFLIAPATAHTIARLANGLADDLLSTSVLASHCPIVICPAMNTKMFSHPATQANIKKLQAYGYTIIDPDSGMMACKDEGKGRLVEWDTVNEYLLSHFSPHDMKGLSVLVTAGPTREPIDPARFISNRSSGKMGYALATAAQRRGAKVTLVSGPTSLACPLNVKRVEVTTAMEMRDAVIEHAEKASVIVKAAAVSDFRPENIHSHKVKKDKAELEIAFSQNPDILYELGQNKKNNQFLVGFAAESQNIIDEGKKKLVKKNLDIIAVNDISGTHTGFAADTNQITLITHETQTTLPLVSKEETASLMWDHILQSITKQ